MYAKKDVCGEGYHASKIMNLLGLLSMKESKGLHAYQELVYLKMTIYVANAIRHCVRNGQNSTIPQSSQCVRLKQAQKESQRDWITHQLNKPANQVLHFNRHHHRSKDPFCLLTQQ